MLVEQMHKLLGRCIVEAQGGNYDPGKPYEDFLSFEECDDLTSRLCWCKSSHRSSGKSQQKMQEGLPTVQEQDESPDTTGHAAPGAGRTQSISIPLQSAKPALVVNLPFEQLAEPCEKTFFDMQYQQSSFDDHELPIHLLVYRSLLQLPMDVRAMCMPRIIFTGGCANVLGLRGRIFDELSRLVQQRGWNPVSGKAVEDLQANTKLKRRVARQAFDGPTVRTTDATTNTQSSGGDGGGGGEGEGDGVWHDAANAGPEIDPIEEQLRKTRLDPGRAVQGEMRCIESLGPWSGGSLVTQLKVPAIATIDRELWLQQGAAGASRPSDVDLKTMQRQSAGAGGLIRTAAAGTNWTLGAWGSI